ncbi:hypothetical protein ASD75_10520 [Acidovorax sp. Root568]|nr:hypothetical protein ASD75_10520 [Acidovorax sp. Root568]
MFTQPNLFAGQSVISIRGKVKTIKCTKGNQNQSSKIPVRVQPEVALHYLPPTCILRCRPTEKSMSQLTHTESFSDAIPTNEYMDVGWGHRVRHNMEIKAHRRGPLFFWQFKAEVKLGESGIAVC